MRGVEASGVRCAGGRSAWAQSPKRMIAVDNQSRLQATNGSGQFSSKKQQYLKRSCNHRAEEAQGMPAPADRWFDCNLFVDLHDFQIGQLQVDFSKSKLRQSYRWTRASRNIKESVR